MKKSNRIRNGIVRCLGSAMCIFVVLPVTFGWKWAAASAAGPEQTTEETGQEEEDRVGAEPDPYSQFLFPICLRFYNGNTLQQQAEMSYGGRWPSVVAPEKEGYRFEGFYSGETQYYDADGEPTGEDSHIEDTELNLYASWTPKTYTVYYGPDSDEDGRPDQSFEAVYDEVYEAVAVPDLPEGEEIKGYTLHGRTVFNEQGKPIGTWRWDVENPVLNMVISGEAVATPTPTPSPSPTLSPTPTPTPTPKYFWAA